MNHAMKTFKELENQLAQIKKKFKEFQDEIEALRAEEERIIRELDEHYRQQKEDSLRQSIN